MSKAPPDPLAFRSDRGPFDIIGDVHGCFTELQALLDKLGYSPDGLTHPEGRKLVFLGDLVDRGPDSPRVVKLVRKVVRAGRGYCVAGNHDDKFRRWLEGRPVTVSHGLQTTIEQFQAKSKAVRAKALAFLTGLPIHLVLDEGRLVVAHAGLKEKWHGKPENDSARAFALYGQRTGKRDEWGFTIRADWAAEYSGKATVVHGHVAEKKVREKNNVICLDTGVAYGGKLTALRWPEREIVQVKSKKVWYRSARWESLSARKKA